MNKGTKEEKEIYYHHVLEAELVLGDGFAVSIGTEFIENEKENVSKNGCETKAFKSLAGRLKKEYPACPCVSWLTDLVVTGKNVGEFARTGRGRWQIENEGFNIQKNICYDIQHANSEDYNAMKCHYLLTQIADILLQIYKKGSPGLREAKNGIKKISSDLLKSFVEPLTGEDILFITAHNYIKTMAWQRYYTKGYDAWEDGKQKNMPQDREKLSTRVQNVVSCG